ncbi:MAG: M20 family metallopeptidase [Gemmatimonadota bacterium]|nr:MAG: M20 family metallopeptidase [Gemmatimonadota bacterium]
MSDTELEGLLGYLESAKAELIEAVSELARIESPSRAPEAQQGVQELLTGWLERLGFSVRHVSGKATGGHLMAVPARRMRGVPFQMLIGHTDTVWDLGTLENMPVEFDEEHAVLRGPGVFDMKTGLVQAVFALRALRYVGLWPTVTPVFFLNSDEEIGSPESEVHIARLAKRADRALVLEPALGPDGHLKTTRRGTGEVSIKIVGKASHAGLAPTEGASAIEELSHVIQALHALADHDRGVGVNVGEVRGGVRPNVVAPDAHAVVDLRVDTMEDARLLEEQIHGLRATTPGTRLEITGGVSRAPMEATPRNQVLWQAAREAGERLGLELEGSLSGGASDGNITSQFTATLDGLGPIGDGAHAAHEFVAADRLVERTALLALVLLLPKLEETQP